MEKRTTHAARTGANALGFDYAGMLAVVMGLQPTDFYKSMTTHADYTIWQDRFANESPQYRGGRRVSEADRYR